MRCDARSSSLQRMIRRCGRIGETLNDALQEAREWIRKWKKDGGINPTPSEVAGGVDASKAEAGGLNCDSTDGACECDGEECDTKGNESGAANMGRAERER